MLSSLKTGNFNARMTITTSERKKRDLLTLTGGLTSANLKSLMGFKEEKETKFYALSIRDSQFKNYKYKKPNVLCEHIFFKETIRKPTGPPKARPSTTQQLENCIENLRSTKKRENERTMHRFEITIYICVKNMFENKKSKILEMATESGVAVSKMLLKRRWKIY